MTCFATSFVQKYQPLNQCGLIKRSAEDFYVRELEMEEPVGSGEHVYLKIRKRHANTHWVARQVAEFCGIRHMDVGYAGRKDRHSVSEQWFSCYLPKEEPSWDDLMIEGVELLAVSRHSRKLRRGDLKGNQFDIRVSGLHPGDQETIGSRINEIKTGGFPNYCGEQRFGRDNLNQTNDFLVSGKRSVAGRDMLISTARSYLFNGYLGSCIEACDIPEFGPLYGRSRDPQPGEHLLKPHEVAWVEGLRRLKVKVGQRRMVVKPESFDWRLDKSDLYLSFALPAGSYATSLLKELVNYKDASLGVDGE
ncbi:MAG TPA: tRNA pseudouridine(13) synthase TruD [Gammaproteobacteria bacterium]|nr:tRNA pseudouridine(13) synthase TruD [Gammaproteobacteria bacterium]|tara:strand:+ start:572 stop:1489 length:918 start_codon:yes stop_codon:yes gene_type:complete